MNYVSGLATAILAGGFLTGCCCHHHHDDDYADRHRCHKGPEKAYRQEGDLATQDWVELRKSPYSPILGDTTGDGLPRDMRTGGGITGNDVTMYDRLRAGRSLPPSDNIDSNPTTRIPPPDLDKNQ
ncbi:MAG: hypothetical protein ACM359_10540 [Bacillota bacterium]